VRILLIRHAEPVPQTGAGEQNERALSQRGARAALALVEQLQHEPIAHVYASPYPRALETVRPLARARGLEPNVIDDLRERLLCAEPLADWLDHVRRSFAEPDYAPPGGESSRVAQQRVAGVLAQLATRHPTETIAVGSHGNLIALALQLDDPAVGFDVWQAMPMPAVYAISR
jgi:2,3-bisphosphoglycerate-dependent phosphoglycerate mutase